MERWGNQEQRRVERRGRARTPATSDHTYFCKNMMSSHKKSLSQNLPIPVVQINIQHSKGGSAALCIEVGFMETFIALIQEPCVNQRGRSEKSKICGLGNLSLYGFWK